MGIKDLSRVLGDHARSAIKENEMNSYFGRIIAIDASMSIYQFLIAVRQNGAQLVDDAGDTTSHLMGMFYRTIRMIENGIKPVYVFDGKPPEMKSDELSKRQEKRAEAEKEHEKAVESGDVEAIDKFSRRLVRVTKEHNAECMRLLKLMGVPYVQAPCEAEAQCAALVKSGKVFATATEDMDALTFGSGVLLRHMTFSEAKKMPIKEFRLEKALSEMELTHEQFVDLCILLGCDYCGSIRGIGQKKAYELIQKHKSIEEVLKHLDKTKYPPPEDWPYELARSLFLEPEVSKGEDVEIKFQEPDEEGLVAYMAGEKNFSEDRIRSGAKKLIKGKHSATQGRIDSFFSVTGTVSSGTKRKAEEKKKATSKKSTRGGKVPKRGK